MGNTKSRLVVEDLENKVDFKEQDKEMNDKKEIPSSYVEIKLPSCGRYGCPKLLHFRDYSYGDVLDLNMTDETGENLCKVLSNLNYEKFDVSKLSEKDVTIILMTLHRLFVNRSLEKKIYIDDTLEEGNEVGQLNNKENIEIVDVNLNELWVRNLGYDEKDNFLADVKIPFTIKDTMTNDKIRVKIPVLEDGFKAMKYCQDYFEDEINKYSNVRSQISKLQSIANEDKQNDEFEKFYSEHESECKEYYKLMETITSMVAKIVQAMQIVEFNGEVVESLEDKLALFNDKISSGVWSQYEDVLSKYDFGIVENIEVFSPTLNKKVVRKIPFSFSDFIPTNDRKPSDRFSVEFD